MTETKIPRNLWIRNKYDNQNDKIIIVKQREIIQKKCIKISWTLSAITAPGHSQENITYKHI